MPFQSHIAIAGRDVGALARLSETCSDVPSRRFDAYDLDSCAGTVAWAHDALGGLDAVVSRATLPPPAERKRLRAVHGLTIDEVATALKVRRATVSGWESGKTEHRPPERDAYARLLDKLAELYPATSAPAPGR